MIDGRVTIVIPVKDREEVVRSFVESNIDLLSQFPVIVVNDQGGYPLKRFATHFINCRITLSGARRIGMDLVDTEYILNLDTHVILAPAYINRAVALLDQDEEIGAISVDHKKLMGHLGFGQSIWRTKVLKTLYDWTREKWGCECIYMWGKLNKNGYRLETVPNYRCEHMVMTR